jgi:hypothetical protein
MAILDFLVPDLAPEQYSSGQGTGYAQQYDLGAPNSFDVAQDYMNNMLQQKKLEQEKDLLNEKTRQEKLNQYISSIEYDPKWEIARSDFDNKVNEIGDFVSEWRASGKPVNQDFHMELNKRKAELNTMKSENEKAFETYNKNMQTMLAGLGKDYTQEDIKAYEKSVTDAYEKGGINEGFKTITTIRPLKEFDLIGWLRKDYVVPENETGTLLETKPEELDKLAKFKWDELTLDRKADQLEKLYLDGNIKEKSPEAAIGYFREQLELWDKEQRARPRAARTGGGGSKTTTPVFSENTVADVSLGDVKERNLQKGDLLNLPLWTQGQNPVSMSLTDYQGIPHAVVVTDVKPYWTGSERKFQVIGIPMDQIKINGSNVADVTQVTPTLVEKYKEKAQAYPLSEYYNAETIEKKFPGITNRIKEQIEKDRKRGLKVTWEKGSKMYK